MQHLAEGLEHSTLLSLPVDAPGTARLWSSRRTHHFRAMCFCPGKVLEHLVVCIWLQCGGSDVNRSDASASWLWHNTTREVALSLVCPLLPCTQLWLKRSSCPLLHSLHLHASPPLEYRVRQRPFDQKAGHLPKCFCCLPCSTGPAFQSLWAPCRRLRELATYLRLLLVAT